MEIEINHLSVIYRENSHAIQALEDVCLKVLPGACLALVGESGSGKTTLGRACMGLLPSNAQRSGQIKLSGKAIDYSDIDALNAIRWKDLAMVFQNGATNLNPLHRVIDQVAEPLVQRRAMGRKEALEKAGDALTGLGLGERHHGRFPHQVSGGQAQRVLLAMALILNPGVVILDEPTASLDAMSKVFMVGVVNRLKAEGKAILLITHDLDLAAALGDRAAVIYLGQVMETMPGKDLLAEACHPYTLALARSFPSMETGRDLGGIRGDAFYRMIHRHGKEDSDGYQHSHIQVPGSSHENGHAPPVGCLFQSRCTQAFTQCQYATVPMESAGDHDIRCLRRGIARLLELRGVSKNYDQTAALGPTDLTLKCGEVFSLVGETGSGKTTFALIAAGTLDPDGGERIFEGRDMGAWQKEDRRSLARRIGVIYQHPAESVNPRFSVRDIVAEPLKIHRPRLREHEVRDRVCQALKEVHLSTDASFLGRYPHELNMGAIQRACLARALILEPSFLVADEPTSALDPSVQAKVLKLLLGLQIERGLTMLFVTHDMGLARKISDRLGVMLQGRFVEIGPAARVMTDPAHPYTRLLVNSVSGMTRSEYPEPRGPVSGGGCAFVPRCPRARERCAAENPEPLDRDGRIVACHFPFNGSV